MSKPNTIYQLRIQLTDLQPSIWRRVEVKDCTLLKLHKIIHVCMGRDNFHMRRFKIDGEAYWDDVMDQTFDWEFISARKRKLSQFIEKGIKRFRYTYDFEDKWVHIIDVEKTLETDPKVKYPICIDGQRTCPPESCGRPWGYEKFLDAIADPCDVEVGHMLPWMDDEFDSEAFNLGEVNRKLIKVR